MTGDPAGARSDPPDPQEDDPQELLAELERARESFAAAERRARAFLVRRGVLDQTADDLASLLREAAGNR